MNLEQIRDNTEREFVQDLKTDDKLYVVDLKEFTLEEFIVEDIKYTMHETYVIRHKKNDLDVLILENSNKSLKNGVEAEHRGCKNGTELVFSNKDNAKKLIYDTIQNTINKLMHRQRKLMKNY